MYLESWIIRKNGMCRIKWLGHRGQAVCLHDWLLISAANDIWRWKDNVSRQGWQSPSPCDATGAGQLINIWPASKNYHSLTGHHGLDTSKCCSGMHDYAHFCMYFSNAPSKKKPLYIPYIIRLMSSGSMAQILSVFLAAFSDLSCSRQARFYKLSFEISGKLQLHM